MFAVFRSLHMKLMLILLLLITSLMAVVGAFLTTSVSSFYIDTFYEQISAVFSDDSDGYVSTLRARAAEPDGAAGIKEMLEGRAGSLGIDYRTRNYFILDGQSGTYLDGSAEASELPREQTANLLTARNAVAQGDSTLVGDRSDITADYMDAAIPIMGGGNAYIIYILDQRASVRELNSQLFQLIIEALAFGLIISVLLSFLLSRAMVNPIRALTRGVKRVADGDFSREIHSESHDEIGVLTTSFNAMASQLQRTLREVESERTKLSTLFLHMTDGVVAFDRNGAVIHSNPAAEEMLDMAIPVGGSVTYQDLFEDIAPLEKILTLDQDCLENEMVRGERILLFLMAPFDQEKQVGVLVVVHDVTQQVKNETLRKEFVANVSHELKTPITNISSYAETLVETPGLPAETSVKFLNVILNESDRMTHIVDDLLTLSRFDSGYSQLNLTTFPFADVLEDSYQAIRIEAQRHEHTLILEGEQVLPTVRADRERVLQVIMNILSNAIKYTPDGGRIVMSAGFDPDRVWLEVTDNGIGIPPEDRERIFERFYRVDKARSRESGGTGLGLSIAKEIIRQHEGKLLLVDRPGPGTTLRMELKREGPKA